MSLSKSEQEILRNVIAKLRPRDNVSQKVKDVLSDPSVRAYLDSWVIAPLEIVASETHVGHRDRISLARSLSR